MDKELKAKWIEALRSGKYQQGIGSLKSFDNRYCCLGVLREIVLPGSDDSAEQAEYLSDALSEKCGLEPYRCHPDNVQKRLGNMNDSNNGFAEIADYIEANL